MATINIPMNGDWVAVAGTGNATITAHASSTEWATGASKPSIASGHLLRYKTATHFNLSSGETLWIKGRAGHSIVADRDTEPA